MELETKRLLLRKAKAADYKDIYEGVSDPNVAKHTANIPKKYTYNDAKKFIIKNKATWRAKPQERYQFVIELKSEKKVIGCLDLHAVDMHHGIGNTGSWINSRYQRKAYMTEAKIAVNNFAFKTLKLRKLCTAVFTDNIASNKTQQRQGYKKEGLLKKHLKSRSTGKIHDEHIYALFKEDWNKKLPALKKHLAEKIKKLKSTKN